MSRHYLKFVRSLPCAICQNDQVQAHHQIGSKMRGMGIKVSDFRAMPLCIAHHGELHSRGHKTWEEQYGITQESLVLRTLEIAIAQGVLTLNPEFC